MAGDGANLLTDAASIMQSRNTRVAERPHGQFRSRDAHRIARIEVNGVARRETVVAARKLGENLAKGLVDAAE